MTDIRIEQHDGWVEVSLHRPERRNAFTGPLLDELADAIDAASDDETVAAVVLRGSEGVFSSGVDLTELQAGHPWTATFHESVHRAHLSLYSCRCPIVVALERYAINGAAALAMAGDLVVAGAEAFLQIGEIRQGAGMPMNAAWLRLKSTESVLSRLALVGDRVPAGELHRLHLVHEVVDDGDVLTAAQAHAMRMAEFPEGASRRVKASIRANDGIDPSRWFAMKPSSALLNAQQLRDK